MDSYNYIAKPYRLVFSGFDVWKQLSIQQNEVTHTLRKKDATVVEKLQRKVYFSLAYFPSNTFVRLVKREKRHDEENSFDA